ncbi:phosphate acyltransferase PlsX [Anoxynatronum buryatiense]|uniref:Phosphate acyltransferase n=1 Tax=Anoxynatronum buryatiense TaxID=489973 RepID=A0AA45WUE5_9CLOT|nr:phosphate acyltransferase PlsX [Anoxynatronum buryatiense]SMP47030.1 phosphate:acyl-[acyl carrier protein] acyltransferase [Anoxynatronum buryatiense]
MKVVMDAMGGDFGPRATVEAALQAIEELGVHMILTGREEVLRNELKQYPSVGDALTIVHCSEIIENQDKPSVALRQKKNSSMSVAFQMVRNGEADAIISAGNTGALLAGGLFILGRIKGISRPALAVPIPTPRGISLLIDAGANADCKPQHLLDFARMGRSYMQTMAGIDEPEIRLVNVGIEAEKGNELSKETYPLLEQAHIGFKGNIEARDIPAGVADVIVCDGFTGNIILKLYEGVAGIFGDTLKQELTRNFVRKAGALLIKPGLRDFKKRFDYTEHGGVPFLGVNGLLIKAHGSSNAKALKNAVRQAKISFENQLVPHIVSQLPNASIELEEATHQ